jgi:hypothetical protein
MALHATEHRQTCFTPNMMMLGREVFLPANLILVNVQTNIQAQEPHEWVRNLTRTLSEVHSLAMECLQSAERRQKRSYDVLLREYRYQPGDLVYKLDEASKTGVSRKLRPPWKAPFLVTKARPPLYQIRDLKK